MKKLILVALLMSISAFCQSTDNERTNGGVNGRFWMTLSDTSRLYFLIGFDEAMGIGNPYGEKDYFSKDAPFGDVVKGITRFYQEPENLRSPVSYALQIFRMKVNGATQAQIEAKLDELRREMKKTEELLKLVK
jgi:hypothetical protein